MSDTGASCHERLRAAARDDNEDELLSALEDEHSDINNADGLGNTALHYAAAHGSTTVIEYILGNDDCDVDPINAVEKATPLHLAVQLFDQDTRHFIVGSLLDAGADITIRDKMGRTAKDMALQDEETMALFRRMEAVNSIDSDDIADDGEESDEYEDEDGE